MNNPYIPENLQELPLPPAGSRVAVAMSGGVDSSLVAFLLAERGCDITGVTMRVYDDSIVFPPGTGNGCYGPGEEEDEEACRKICKDLGVEYKVLDLSKIYAKEVLQYFKDEYRSGRTPNPCLRCNPIVKFGMLPETLKESGVEFDYFVTGHYVRLLAPDGNPDRGVYLSPAADVYKDQSYFLQRVPQSALRMSRFPLGSLTKTEVRRLARERGLETADKKDSQDFVASEDYGPLFADNPPGPGDIVDNTDRVLGKHRGIIRYTIGQRRGLGVSTGPDPLYVLAIDAEKNRIRVGPESALYSPGLEASQACWAPGYGTQEFRALVKIRLASKPVWALVKPLGSGAVQVYFDDAQRAVAPGQSVAFYIPVNPAVSDPGIARVAEASFLAGGAIIDRAFS